MDGKQEQVTSGEAVRYSPASRREQQVKRFHERYGCPEPAAIGPRLQRPLTSEDHLLESTSNTLDALSVQLAASFSETRDYRLLRAKLQLSETSELLAALAAKDETALADALADIEYVTVGTAVAYAVPLGDVFDAVHESNMTKSTVESAAANHSGDRGKGPRYVPPDVEGAIKRGRARKHEYQRGDMLATRDGRVIGNVTVTLVDRDGNGIVTGYEVLSDYGNTARLTVAEMAAMFYAEPIARRSLKGEADAR